MSIANKFNIVRFPPHVKTFSNNRQFWEISKKAKLSNIFTAVGIEKSLTQRRKLLSLQEKDEQLTETKC